jgi:hypothetical protein
MPDLDLPDPVEGFTAHSSEDHGIFLMNPFTCEECGPVSPLLILFLSPHLDSGTGPGQPAPATPKNE